MKQADIPSFAIASEFGVNKSTVDRRWRKFKEGKSFYYKSPKAGRPRALNRTELDVFVAAAEAGEWEDVPDLKRKTGAHVSNSTARNYLKEAGFITRRKQKVPLIRPENAKKWLDWANSEVGHTVRYWRRRWFSNEKKFNCYRQTPEAITNSFLCHPLSFS